MGYAMGAIDWGWLGNYLIKFIHRNQILEIKQYNKKNILIHGIGTLLGGHVRAVFTLVLFIFIFCVSITLTSFNEIPLDVLTTPALRVNIILKKKIQHFLSIIFHNFSNSSIDLFKIPKPIKFFLNILIEFD